MGVSRHKQNLADIGHRERWDPRLRELKKSSVIKREGRLDVNYRRESVHKKKAGKGELE